MLGTAYVGADFSQISGLVGDFKKGKARDEGGTIITDKRLASDTASLLSVKGKDDK